MMSLEQIRAMRGVLEEVSRERHNQHEKWGEQNHPDGTDPSWEFAADQAKDTFDQRFSAGICTWQSILNEEVCEAYAETDPETLREELIQVAAVAVAWVEAIDRR